MSHDNRKQSQERTISPHSKKPQKKKFSLEGESSIILIYLSSSNVELSSAAFFILFFFSKTRISI